MKVLIFGATGMVGQGVLLECLRDPGVELIVTVGRTPTARKDGKLREIVHQDMESFAGMEDTLAGFDACFYCLGMTSAGMTEAEYDRITYRFTLSAAEMLATVHPGMTFIYVSGMGTDSTERGRTMWARVKGKTENALLKMKLSAYMFRPGFIQPLDGIQSKTPLYRKLYKVVGPAMTVARRVMPNLVLTTRDLGLAMLAVTRNGYEKRVLEMRDLRAIISGQRGNSPR